MEKDAPPPYEQNDQPQNIDFVQPSSPPGYGPTVCVTTTQPLAGQHQAINFGPSPQSTVCSSCHALVTTRIKNEATSRTHLAALLIFCCLCWPCAYLPYCMDSCQNQNHYCPECEQFLGSYEH